MKRVFILIVVLNLMHITSGQFVTEGYMKKMPALPKDSCNISKQAMENFMRQVDAFQNEVSNAIAQMERSARQDAESNEAAARQQAAAQMAQFGLSQEEMAKMQSGKMSAAEKQALANKILQQQANMSMDEVKAYQGMSQEGKAAYKEAMSVEMEAAAKSGQFKSSTVPGGSGLSALIAEQQQIMSRISSSSEKFAKLYIALENNAERKQMLSRIESWRSKWLSMSGVDAGQGRKMDSLIVLIKNEQVSYCNKFMPLYRNALRVHLSTLKSSLPDFRRLAEVTGKISESQTGIPAPAGGTDISGMNALNEYLDKLGDAYNYKLFYPEDY